jgi:hypothetical protein
MKNINTQKLNRLALLSLVLISLFAASCSKSTDEETTPTQHNNNTSNITNNTVMHADATGTLTKYWVLYTENDVNNGGDAYEVAAWTGDFLALADNYLRIFLNEVPTASKTYTWQTGGSSPGALTSSEFFVQARINGQTWYGVYSTTAWTTTGSLQATVDGDKIIFAFSDIELSDNFISTNVTATKKISGKITISKNADVSDGTNWYTLDLLD